jgi:hypothetical protein
MSIASNDIQFAQRTLMVDYENGRLSLRAVPNVWKRKFVP